MNNLAGLIDTSNFIDKVKTLIETLLMDSLSELDHEGIKLTELAKSIGRVITSTFTMEAALDNFKNVDKSKFVKGPNWAIKSICF